MKDNVIPSCIFLLNSAVPQNGEAYKKGLQLEKKLFAKQVT